MIVAIDGPAGSGKSTVSRRVARRLGWDHLDTGAFYRAATLAVLRAGADPHDPHEVVRAVADRNFQQEKGRMMIDGEDVSLAIRSAEVTAWVSPVAAHPELRALMTAEQRRWVEARGRDAVVEGRDIGTVVFPQAELKIWLEASPEERARRRAAQTGEDEVEVARAIRARDQADATRSVSPQVPAPDAVHIDTTDLTVDEVVEAVISHLPPPATEGSVGGGGPKGRRGRREDGRRKT
ncbi:MAG TPA: (d)CMP kinase [Acidimicrobiia bacterium]|nr:(d)CMP kinase [Acidimicrobiia bacterium]